MSFTHHTHYLSPSKSLNPPPTTPEPPIPPALIEHMRRAWWDYHNNPRGET